MCSKLRNMKISNGAVSYGACGRSLWNAFYHGGTSANGYSDLHWVVVNAPLCDENGSEES